MDLALDLARAPRRALLTARKKGSGYKNEVEHFSLGKIILSKYFNTIEYFVSS
jgi:hypothetical protein